MKKNIAILIIAIISFTGAMAQQGNGSGGNRMQGINRDEIQSMKIAFMTETLSLTPAESEKFWPIYNKYWEERVKVAHQRRGVFMKIEKETATQADIDSLIKLAHDEADLMSKFTVEVTRVISVDKAAKTFIAEEKFKNNLLRRTQGGGNMGGSKQ